MDGAVTETVEQKAARIVAEGRLTVRYRVGADVYALCDGDHGSYHLGRTKTSPGGYCECPTRSRRCSHLIALALVTDPKPDKPEEPDAA